jgi:hypothetical protein
MTEFRVPDIPALRVFDAKATRGAVIRGLLRTAFVVIGFLVVASLVIGIGVHITSRALGRPAQLDRMVAAYKVAHPGFAPRAEGSAHGGWHQTATLDGSVGDQERHAHLSLSMFGNLDVSERADDPVNDLLDDDPWSKSATTAFLQRVPSAVRLDGIVLFTRPTTRDALVAANFPSGEDRFVYGRPLPVLEGRTGPVRTFFNPVTWPATPIYPYDSFQDWAKDLSASDDANLDRLALPKSSVIKELADKGEVTAAYVVDRTPDEVAALLKGATVASFSPSAVRFDLRNPR